MTHPKDRRHARVIFSRQVEVTFSDQTRERFTLSNISQAGLFLNCDNKFFLGERCVITLTEKWAKRNYTLSIFGKVVRLANHGVAIKFLSMKPETLMMLQTSLLYHCQDPLALGEEFAGICPVILDDRQEKQFSSRFFS